jgi:hypothetical protein
MAKVGWQFRRLAVTSRDFLEHFSRAGGALSALAVTDSGFGALPRVQLCGNGGGL